MCKYVSPTLDVVKFILPLCNLYGLDVFYFSPCQKIHIQEGIYVFVRMHKRHIFPLGYDFSHRDLHKINTNQMKIQTGGGGVTLTTSRVGETYLHISTSQKHKQGNDRKMTNLNSLELLF